MAASSASSSISVTVRVRPFTIREAAQLTKCDDGPLFLGDGSLAAASVPKLMQKGLRPVIKVVDDRCLIFDPPEDNPVQRFSRSVVPNGKKVKDQTFAFDRVFDDNVTQGEVYEATTRNLLDSVLDGYNATVFAYGATGCGKTHTITGTAQQPGIIFMTMQELFERIAERSEEKVTELSLSYLEIYNETIRDLLVPGGAKSGLMLREDANQSVSVPGLSSHRPQNVQEVMDMIMKGNECRTMSPTEANATSSRSHAVLQINVAQKDRNADVNEPHTMATLSIIDLAGSERASATKNRGERLIEGANINKSLLALGSCINALCDPRKRNHVPYRNSKLTRLLKFSLGGNCRTVMIVCVSPSSQHFDETQNTLRYANRAKNIQTKVTRNVFNVNRHVKDFLVKIDEQMALINELKKQQKDYETVAFAKFKKQTEKKDGVTREAICRIRNAYDHSAPERQDKTNDMLKLRQISKRISMLSSWIAAFDSVCDNCEDAESMSNLQAIRKTAQGIMIELEGSRHHYHQRIARNNWERAINSALENSLRQIQEVEVSDQSDIANLTREAELLKSNAEREALSAITESEKAGDVATVQVLLHAHFEMMAAIENIMRLSQEEAIQTGTKILTKMLNSCVSVTSNIVKPDGKLPQIMPVEMFPPSKMGTPKRRKSSMAGSLPVRRRSSLLVAPQASAPVSPKRRKFGATRKGVNTSPKKSQVKVSKRSVRWKDDVDDGSLAEFEKTPKREHSTPQPTINTPPSAKQSAIPRASSPLVYNGNSRDSSPLGTSPPATLDIQKNSRFKAGFLSKRASNSPVPPTLTSLGSSDTDSTPLRNIENSSFLNRPGPDKPSLENLRKGFEKTCRLSIGSATSNSENETEWKADMDDAMKIKKAMRRVSGVPMSSNAAAAHRRRSPTGASASSPSDNAMFTASQARRMVKSEKETESKASVLSAHTMPITKGNGQRRTTFDTVRPKEAGLGVPGLGVRDGIRLSANPVAAGSRGSLMTTGKGSWR